jgi:hypothetical protein
MVVPVDLDANAPRLAIAGVPLACSSTHAHFGQHLSHPGVHINGAPAHERFPRTAHSSSQRRRTGCKYHADVAATASASA